MGNTIMRQFTWRMPLSEPIISVIVPHLNQPDSLDACLRSLEAQTIDRRYFEIVVVDNGSTPVPESIVRRHGDARLLEEPEPGPGLARNRGVQAANGQIFAFIDADCRAHPDWLRNAIEAMETMPEHTVLGGDVQIWRSDASGYTAIEAYESVFAYRFKNYIEQQGFCGTGNLVVRSTDFAMVGPFAGISIAEDMEWGARARAKGCTIRYVPNMIVYHPARQSLRELFVKWDRQLQHYVNMGDGSWSWKLRWSTRAFATLASPLLDWSKIANTDRVSGLSARVKAFGVLVAVRAYRARRMIYLLRSGSGVVWNREDKAVKS
jgi:glycosyltransferase involved in cell wall biosynthesis